MNYIWQNYDAENDFYIDVKPLSPYLEIGHVGNKKIGVNPLPRLYKIFAPYFEYDYNNTESENILLHYLANLDRHSGIHKVTLLEYRLDEEIRAEGYGKRAAELYLSLTENDRRVILIYLQRHESASGLNTYFIDAVEQFFPASKFYFHEWEQKFLFCLPFDENLYNCNLMELIILLFLDANINYEIFWNIRFGIIDDETMTLNEFVIY